MNMKVVRKSMSGGFFNRIGRKLFGRRDVLTSANMKSSYQKCYDSILTIHHRVMVSTGEERERGLEDSVLNSAAIQGFCDALEYYPSSISKAALAIDYIANFHPFVEGNKRTAFEVAVALLRKGGLELNDDDETFNFIKDVAWGKYDREDIEVWLRCNTHLSIL